jgi:hypothetical protein
MAGRLLKDGEVVHHIDGNRFNNEDENLQIMTTNAHSTLHRKVEDIVKLVCPVCGDGFSLKPHQYRLRSKRTKDGSVYCSRRCGGTQ